MTLIDINECMTNNGGCEHICINKEPLFDCFCHFGFRSQNFQYCSSKFIDLI